VKKPEELYPGIPEECGIWADFVVNIIYLIGRVVKRKL
jgi:hypothetical protein